MLNDAGIGEGRREREKKILQIAIRVGVAVCLSQTGLTRS